MDENLPVLSSVDGYDNLHSSKRCDIVGQNGYPQKMFK